MVATTSGREPILHGIGVGDLTRHEADSPPTTNRRVAALDGLRGVVIISVVLNHSVGVLWSRGQIYDIPVVNGLLGGGAVIVFFVVGGFIVTDGLMRERERGTFDPWRFYLRRLVRVGGQLVAVCVVVSVVLAVDPDTPSGIDISANVIHTLTYTFNNLVSTDPYVVGSEFGHLWYLAVQQQCYLVLPLLLAVLGRWRPALVALLVVAMVAIYIHRQNVLDDRGWVVASSLTTTRSDGLLWGVALAVALPWLSRIKAWGHVLWVAVLVLVALKLVLPELGTYDYLRSWSIPFTLVAGIVVVAVWLLPSATRVSRALEWAPLRRLGTASLAIFVWHLPIIVIVSRHTGGWSWVERTFVSFVILAAVVWASERWIDEPIRKMLATRPVFRIRREPAS
ncbi:MAG: Peptidoglycan/LPS O-acetylase OafA/YrhL, contains acyltransferase and SGNH-hydrolase domain [Aeromicrobium sp.]|nr:Peptidoglycan/LPS O-acetylase OafA/YrhL, contains acyltransferase and SGNH-hydrolase domain [Aeromicrobium sp.]